MNVNPAEVKPLLLDSKVPVGALRGAQRRPDRALDRARSNMRPKPT